MENKIILKYAYFSSKIKCISLVFTADSFGITEFRSNDAVFSSHLAYGQ